MQNRYPLWKYVLILVITVAGFIYALPNLYGDAPVIQISPVDVKTKLTRQLQVSIGEALKDAKINVESLTRSEHDVTIKFHNTESQIKARDILKSKLGAKYTVALNLIPETPGWLKFFGASPMKYGLDLRGGVHFLLDVDVDAVVARREDGMIKNISQDLRDANIRFTRIFRQKEEGVSIFFRSVGARDTAFSTIRQRYPELLLEKKARGQFYVIRGIMSQKTLNEIRQNTIEQTMMTLRNRVNELGVSEPVVQQQGATRIAVDLPGIQDAARAKQILGGTATVEFHMVDELNEARAIASGVAPIGSRLYEFEGRPVLLKNQVILSGQSITGATAGFDQYGKPAVNISLGGGGESYFSRTTAQNVHKRMAIVFVETKTTTQKIEGKITRTRRKVEKVISVAVIQEPLVNRFQIMGLSSTQESQKLALFLRAGALPTPIDPVEERLVGPSLGKENVAKGLLSLEVGLGIILILMILYYRVFGIFANIALVLNLVLLVALLSMVQAVLTLPGIAGIVLTMGMAVDANVLIYERIREELRLGASIQAAIYSGYERAFATIVDANVTTLIVAVVLFAIGTGPVKGFAVTLMIGLLTSMLTGVTFSRAMVNLTYGYREVKRLSIGI